VELQVNFKKMKILISLGGIITKCNSRACEKVYHILCAYLEGYQIKLKDVNDTKNKPTENGLIGEIFCPEHCNEKNVENFPLLLFIFQREIQNNKNISEDI